MKIDIKSMSQTLSYTRVPVVSVYIHKGRDEHDPLQTLVNGMIVYKGVLDKPICTLWVQCNDAIF